MQPLPVKNELVAHLAKLEYQGYTLVPDAVPPPLLQEIRAKFDELVANHAQVPTAICDETTGIVDLNRLYELDQVFEHLMDLPSVFPIIAAAVEGDSRYWAARSATTCSRTRPPTCAGTSTSTICAAPIFSTT